ncbi:hypothetical protein PALB_21430 [Pseudoalteromonas luteoviolacea B = ATCC 29581]|nr:hypothetical protein PALB_21430 [Pseudoalteromonas luteoviolacea B = ATCC 29581]
MVGCTGVKPVTLAFGLKKAAMLPQKIVVGCTGLEPVTLAL